MSSINLLSPVESRPCPCQSTSFWCNQMRPCIFFYILLSSVSIIVLKFVNYRYELVLPLLWAMVSEATWIITFPMFFAFRQKGSLRNFMPSAHILLICAVIGFGYTISKSAISYAENVLPGSVFAIMASLDLLFNGLFSSMILKKRLSKSNKIAIVFVMLGALPSAISDIIIAPEHHGAVDNAQKITGLTLALAIPVALFGIAEESLSTVCSSYVLKKRFSDEGRLSLVDTAVSIDASQLTSDTCNDNILFIIQYSSWVSFFAFSGMLIPLLVSGEAKMWKPVLTSAWTGTGPLKHAGYDAVVGISIAVIATLSTRIYMRCAKYYICSLRTAFTFGVVKPLPKILEVIVLCFGLGEVITWQKVFAMIMAAAGFLVHVRAEQAEIRKSFTDNESSPCRCHQAHEPLLATVETNTELFIY